MRRNRRLALGAALLLAGIAAAAGAAPPKKLAREAIPAGFAIGSGQPSLELEVKVEGGAVVSSAPASGGQGSLRAVRSGGEDDGQTMLTISGSLDVAVKFDLYVSRDGRTFEYASSCAVTPGISSFEMWRYPVREFAFGNVRAMPAGRMSCD
ncbi:hypothetical protein [Pseudoxanthomonas mexicana]|uniref:hypothetical protein n=1 Tax=Pseudoxanthomonas mexicana TaxID=128785 RepID=UPI00398AFBA6